MMGLQDSQPHLFSFRIHLDHHIRSDHPLRAIKQHIDFAFVRAKVARCYGKNGNESIDPVVIMKRMFLLFYDNVASERELMRQLPGRLDYLWFLGFELDTPILHHSVLS